MTDVEIVELAEKHGYDGAVATVRLAFQGFRLLDFARAVAEPSERLREAVRRAEQRELVALAEADELRADLISCRATVKTELNHYERLAMVHGKNTAHHAAYEAEAQRLNALLERINGLMGPNTGLVGKKSEVERVVGELFIAGVVRWVSAKRWRQLGATKA